MWKKKKKKKKEDKFSDQLTILNSDISSCTSYSEVETCVTDFVRIIDTVAAPLFKQSVHDDADGSSFTYKNDAPWFTELVTKNVFIFMISRKK